MHPFEYQNPKTISDAACAVTASVADAMVSKTSDALREDVAIVKAGGIDLLDLMKEGLLKPRRVVNLRRIEEIRGIRDDADGRLHIGAMTSLEALASHPAIRARYAALFESVNGSASPQLRRMGTLAGNLLQRPRCWYFRSAHHHCARKGGETCFAFAGENQYHAIFDHDGCAIVHPSTLATVLVALGATIELASADSRTRTHLLEDFFLLPTRDVHRENDLKPGEIVTAINLPPMPPTTRSAYLKQSEKDSFDWPLAEVAVVVDLGSDKICRKASIVLGAAAPVPHRARSAEAILLGRCIDGAVAAEASRAALSGAKPLSKNRYKLPIFEALVRRAILRAAGVS
jgi:xanthine dehydrogenase YagS FAD-binding subunit